DRSRARPRAAREATSSVSVAPSWNTRSHTRTSWARRRRSCSCSGCAASARSTPDSRQAAFAGAASHPAVLVLGPAGGAVAGLFDRLLRRDQMLEVAANGHARSEEHTSELQSRFELVCRLLLE